MIGYKDCLSEYIELLNSKKTKAEQNQRAEIQKLDWFFNIEENTLHKNWKVVNILDVTWVITCGVAKKPDYTSEGIPFLSAQNTRPFKNNTNKIKYISEKDYKKFTVGSKPVRDDILYTRVGNCGDAAKIEFDFNFAIYVSLTLIKPIHELINSDYLVAFLNSNDGRIQAASGAIGTGLQNLNVNNVRKYKIPLPPLTEQNRIVAKLDSLFAQLESIKTSMAKIPILLKNFRQQLLTQAVTGKLTEEWRVGKELEDVNKYYKRIEIDLVANYKSIIEKAIQSGNTKPRNQKNNKISDKGDPILQEIPHMWKYCRAEELCYLITDGVHFKPNYIESGVKFLSVKNVRPFKINSDNCKFISEDDHLKYIQRCNPENGDILYTKVGATYGYAAKVDLDFDFSIFVSLALIKPSKLLNSSFMELLFNSPIIFNQANFKVSGIGVPDLHLIEIRDFKIPLPSFVEQKEIVSRVESLFAKADAIEEKYKNLKAKIETLPQTILHKAFKGELTEQLDSDGDAKVLLEEIAALKDGEKPKKVVSKKYVQPDEEVLRIMAEPAATDYHTKVEKTPDWYNERFELWVSQQGLAARGTLDKTTLRELFDAMDDEDK